MLAHRLAMVMHRNNPMSLRSTSSLHRVTSHGHTVDWQVPVRPLYALPNLLGSGIIDQNIMPFRLSEARGIRDRENQQSESEVYEVSRPGGFSTDLQADIVHMHLGQITGHIVNQWVCWGGDFKQAVVS